MSEAMAIGFVCGIVVVVALFKALAKKFQVDGSTRTEYDERQLIERGKGYRCAFFAFVIYSCIFLFLDLFVEVKLSIAVIMICGVLVAAAVHVVYCIFHEAYWGLNNNVKGYIRLLIVAFALNLVLGIANGINSDMYTEGVLSYSVMNLIVAIFIAVILAAMLIKWVRDKREVE